MTKKEAIFLTKFMGKCWHEPKEEYYKGVYLQCKHCGYAHTDSHKGSWREKLTFSEVQTFMEANHAEMWEEYLAYCHGQSVAHEGNLFTLAQQFISDLSNLVAFLLQNDVEKWGWVECEVTNRCQAGVGTKTACFRKIACINWSGKIKHPAYEYALKEGMIKEVTHA